MLDKRINMNIAEPLLPACPIGYALDGTARGGVALWVVCAALPVLTSTLCPPPTLQKLSNLLHIFLHTTLSVFATVVIFSRLHVLCHVQAIFVDFPLLVAPRIPGKLSIRAYPRWSKQRETVIFQHGNLGKKEGACNIRKGN